MGTRNLTAVYKNGTHKIAQYGQWDGYPSGVGASILDFLQTEGNIAALDANIDDVRFITQEEFWALVLTYSERETGQLTQAEFDEFSRANPALIRDTADGILDLVANHGVKLVRDDIDFANDSIFCEWAYVIDLDTRVFEVYEGFQRAPHSAGRFAEGKVPERTETYYPVALLASFPLDDLPTHDDFLKLEGEDDD